MVAKIKDVARLAGVSNATVSRVLANHPHVREDVRCSVRAAMRQLHYLPNRTAQSLRAQRAKILGLIISDITNPFFLGIVRAVEDVAAAHQYAIFLCNGDEDPAKEELYANLMLAEGVAGVIISPSRAHNDSCNKLIASNTPLVVIDRQLADVDVDTVAVDNEQGAFELVSHLIADGHTRIGAVLSDPIITTGRERYEGYCRALAAHGIPLRPDLVRTGLPRDAQGLRLSDELLALAAPPTALFTGNNLLTIGALRAIQRRGLRMPADIGLVGFDDIDWMALVQPGVTVAAQPTYALGRDAAELLLQRIREPHAPAHRVLRQPRIIIRDSCARHATAAHDTTATAGLRVAPDGRREA